MRRTDFLGFVVLVVIVSWATYSCAQDSSNRLSSQNEDNLARLATVRVSSEQSGTPGANATDGNPATEWSGVEQFPWIHLEWKEPIKIARIVIRDRHATANRVQGGKARFSDGTTLDIDDIAPGGRPNETCFEPRTTTSLRLDFFSANGKNPGLAEIEVYADGKPAVAAPVVYPKPGTPRHHSGKGPSHLDRRQRARGEMVRRDVVPVCGNACETDRIHRPIVRHRRHLHRRPLAENRRLVQREADRRRGGICRGQLARRKTPVGCSRSGNQASGIARDRVALVADRIRRGRASRPFRRAAAKAIRPQRPAVARQSWRNDPRPPGWHHGPRREILYDRPGLARQTYSRLPIRLVQEHRHADLLFPRSDELDVLRHVRHGPSSNPDSPLYNYAIDRWARQAPPAPEAPASSLRSS